VKRNSNQEGEGTMQLRQVLVLAILVGLAGFGTTSAAEKKWTHNAEVSWVQTSGNSESSTIGLADTSERKWEAALLTLKAKGIRVNTTTISYVDDGTNAFRVKNTEKTAENYLLSARYQRDITERLFWYAGAGWERNIFAGIDSRYVGAAGVGNIWWDREDLKFRSDYGLSYTQQDDVVEVPGRDPSFFGVRGSWDYFNKWGKNVDYVNEFDIYLNMETSKDWRAAMINAVTVTMTDRLALKVSLTWLYQNDPAFTETVPNQIPIQLENLDSIFVTSLVITF
jgi:putative salt-induced outer membrane protein